MSTAWIPISERLPAEEQLVLAFGRGLMDETNDVYPATFRTIRGRGDFSLFGYEDDGDLRDVTHWMDMPKGPWVAVPNVDALKELQTKGFG